DLTLDERLRVAGYVAPVVRAKVGRTFKTYSGRTIDSRVVLAKLAERVRIEFAGDPTLTERRLCDGCGRPFERPLRASAGGVQQRQQARLCERCRTDPRCSSCGKPVPVQSMRRATAKGLKPRCIPCTAETRRKPRIEPAPKHRFTGPCTTCGAEKPGGNGFWRKGLCRPCYSSAWRQAHRPGVRSGEGDVMCRCCRSAPMMAGDVRCSGCAAAAPRRDQR